MAYRYLTQRPQWGTVNDLQFQAMIRQLQDQDASNLEIYRKELAIYQQIMALVDSLYSSRSSVPKYMRRQKPAAPILSKSQIGKLASRWRRELNERELRQMAEEQAEGRRLYEQNLRRRRKEETEVLAQVGFIEGEHFHEGNAITFAKRNLTTTPEGQRVPMLPVVASKPNPGNE